MMRIGIVGAGAWGTSLASILAEEDKNEVILWSHEREVAEEINEKHQNRGFLKEISLPKRLQATSSIEEAICHAKILVNAVPSHLTRGVWEKGASFVPREGIVVNASKGFEFETLKRLSEVLSETVKNLPKNHFVTLSGPSFAREVAMHQPTTLVIAGTDKRIVQKIQKLFRRSWLLTYINKDVIGVEVGGAVKNVIAIATGICDGMGLGLNTRAALITRGLYEMTKLGKSLGANPLTFAGLSGMGDLILTCTGDLSRNRTVGLRLGRGENLKTIFQGRKEVAEGVKSAKAVFELTVKYHLNNPVCTEIYKILYEEKNPSQALKDLLSLELEEELGGLLR